MTNAKQKLRESLMMLMAGPLKDSYTRDQLLDAMEAILTVREVFETTRPAARRENIDHAAQEACKVIGVAALSGFAVGWRAAEDFHGIGL